MADVVVLRNRYRVMHRLGAGGGGSVYAVEDLQHPDDEAGRLALKALFPDSEDDGLLEGLRQEFRVLATLQHPLLARVYDFGVLPADSGLDEQSSREGYYLTRDLIDGSDLAQVAKRRNTGQTCRLLQRAAQLLDLLHRAGMVHGDFKPANVIVDTRDRVHLIDFGLAGLEGRRGTSGTAAYLAPEMLRGAAVDRRADLYALGISLYQTLTGELPLPDASVAEVLDWHLRGPRLSLREKLPEAPDELEETVLRLTERDPERRFPSAAEAALALAKGCRALGCDPHDALDSFIPGAAPESLIGPLSKLEDFTLRQRHGASSDETVVAAIVGEPGAGKTTLLRELSWRRQLDGTEVLRADFQQADERPYGPIRDLLDQIAGLCGRSHPLTHQAAPEESVAAPHPDDDANRRYAVLQRVADYLIAAARERPLLLLLDNVEQAASDSVEALRFFNHTLTGEPLALVLAIESESPMLETLHGISRIDLDGLPVSAIVALIHSACGRQDEALAARIRDHTGGNPQFVHEVLQNLDQLGWPTTFDPARLTPPTALEEMYARRWKRTDAAARRALEALALLGRPASNMLVAALLGAGGNDADPSGCDPLIARGTLEGLEAGGWLTRTTSGAWAFRQGRVARIVRRWIDDRRARALHRAVVVLLDQQPDRDVVERTHHALGAGDLDLAWTELPAAIGQLRRLGAHERAAEISQAAVALIQSAPADHPLHPRLDQLRCELGQLYRLSGDYARAEAQLAPVALGDEGPHWASARIELARVAKACGSAPRALELLAPLRSAAVAEHVRMEALVVSAEAHADLDQHDEVLALTDEGLAPVSAASSATDAALRGQRAWSLGHLQRHDEAQREFEAALAAARAADNPRAMVDTLNRWAVISWRQGSYAEVERRYSEALEIAQRVGEIDRAAVVRFNLAGYHLQRGELAAALRHLPESLRLFEAMGAQQKAASARCNLGQLQVELGLYEHARETLEQARAQMAQLGRKSGQALATLLLALVAARDGRFAPARRGIAEARALYLQVGQSRDAADALLDLADVELEDGDPSAALSAVQQAAGEVDLEQIPDLHARAATLRARAVALEPQSAAQHGEVAAALERATSLAAKLGSPQSKWQCHFAALMLARALGDQRRAASEARQAHAILLQIAQGLPTDVRHAFWADRRRREIQRATAALSGETMKNSDQAALEGAPTARRDALTHERFYRLLEIYRQINSELDSERLLGMVMDTAVELTGAERGFLLLAGEDEQFRVEVARNLDPSRKGSAYSRSIAERVFRSGQPVVTVSAHQDPRFSDYASVHQLQLESVLCIPIHAPKGVMGVLYMESRFRSGRFQPDDQRILMAFGDQVAIALTNARLYEQVNRQTDELKQAKAEIEALAEQRATLLAERTVELQQAERDLARTRRQVRSESGQFGLVGLSEPMLRLYQLIERVAPTDLPVLVEGESGTGKEMVAQALHQHSQRRKKRLVSINCAAISENLLESELFGHVRGAFTGADRDRKGLFAVADGGSLFLDEIGDMPMRMQVDLLRALQEQIIRPVGGQRDIKVDVRVIAASNRPLGELVKAGKFREDLFYRLHVVRLVLPPLRDRTEDVPLLVDHFLGKIGTQFGGTKRRITRTALDLLAGYGWPGNVRQLEHALMNAAVLSSSEQLDTSDFHLESPRDGATPSHPESEERATTPLPDQAADERARILRALEQCGWNKTKAARSLGMPRRTFYRRLDAYGIE